MEKLPLKSSSIMLLLLFFILQTKAQNKSGYKSVFGGGGKIVMFDGTTNKPTTKQLYVTTPWNYKFWNSSSCISDSANGTLLMLCDGSTLYDTLGNIIENGDSLQPPKMYVNSHSSIPQGSLILPKGSNGLYYIFIPTRTDSLFDYFNANPNLGHFQLNLLQYHVVDMNANNGAGKVIQKNIPLLTNANMNFTGMMAMRHSNGYDWWLLKQALDTNMVYTFLVTKDTVVLDTIQGFTNVHFGDYQFTGQSCFSSDGSKYAFASGGGYANTKGAQLCIYDFDRCYGILSNPKVIHVPYDSSLTGLEAQFNAMDSLITGIAFSPNNQFLYINRRFTVYQYELNEPDSSLAWYLVKQGCDTIEQQFAGYGQLQKGIDNRIYIGKVGGTGTQNSIIDYPNLKGNACGFCRKCLREGTTADATTSLANIPDFNLGNKTCFPLQTYYYPPKQEYNILVYPNPATDYIEINSPFENGSFILINLIGQEILKAELKNNKTIIKLPLMANGTYSYKLIYKNEVYNGKITIKK